MTVSFAPVEALPVAWSIRCACSNTTSLTEFGDRESAVAALNTIICEDEFCAAYPPLVIAVHAEVAPYLNVSNRNAGDLLTLLGYGQNEDLCGSTSAADLLGRVLIAVAVEPADAGRPSTTSGNLIDCGRPAAYFEDRLAELRTVCEWAEARGVGVAWA
jgi:hypothetical protein